MTDHFLLSPSAAFFVSFHIERSVGQQVLDNSSRFTVLCGVVEFLYQKYMVHCVVYCRQVQKSGSRDISYLVAIFYVLSQIPQLPCTWLSRSKDGLFLDEVSFNGRRYSVQDQSFV